MSCVIITQIKMIMIMIMIMKGGVNIILKKMTFFILIIMVLLLATSNLIAFPYPPYQYSNGFDSQSTNQEADNDFVLNQWNTWKSTYITTDGAQEYLRVQRPQNSYDTVSEGMGYGMLFSVYMDEQNTFDRLYSYVKLYQDGNALMDWRIDSSGNVIGRGPATDADEDIALALIFADKKWGGYSSEAMRVLDGAYRIFIESDTYLLKPGNWGGSDTTNISYYMPAAYRIFADYTGQAGWMNVIDTCYEVINRSRHSSTYLVPDWCTIDGTPSGGHGYNYYNDAVRTPWRISIDYLWYGESRASDFCAGITGFFNGIGAANIQNGYTLDGTYLGSGSHANILYQSTAAVGALSSNQSQFAKDCYNIVKNGQPVVGYYEDDLRLFSLLAITGNFPNLYTYNSSQTPGSTDPPPVTLGDVDSNGNINIIDALILSQYYVGLNPPNFNPDAADVTRDGSINIVDALVIAQCYVGLVSCSF